jgi:hypothetical protein
VVSRRSKVLSVLVLTEDSGGNAYATVRALAKEMLKLLVPGVQTDRIGFSPLGNPAAEQAMNANCWKSTKPRYERSIRLLIRSLVTELLKPEGFILYHIDGDQQWSARATSENVRKFKDLILQPVQRALDEELPARDPSASVSERMKRFRLLVPFYSIEAWLFQNTREAYRLCIEKGCGKCQPKLDAWERNRASLDEVDQPKKNTADGLCLRDKYNAQLASTGFPAAQVYEAKASFTQAIDDLLDCDELTALLEKTYALPGSEPPTFT